MILTAIVESDYVLGLPAAKVGVTELVFLARKELFKIIDKNMSNVQQSEGKSSRFAYIY